MSDPNQSERHDVYIYLVGYGLALILTGLAFASVYWKIFGARETLAIVLTLALIQAIVHFRFFLLITLEKSASDDLRLILFSTLIITLMVSGTLVILANLHSRMM